jgi:hypothetical protein
MEGMEVGGIIETGELFAIMMPKDSPLSRRSTRPSRT